MSLYWVAPIALVPVGLVGLIVLDTCKNNERIHATIVLDLGEHGARERDEIGLALRRRPPCPISRC